LDGCGRALTILYATARYIIEVLAEALVHTRVELRRGLFTQRRGETVWKIAEGTLDRVCSMAQDCEIGLLCPFCPLVEPQTGGHPDFPNSFGRGVLRSSLAPGVYGA
jgi:hypothetical protein